MSDVAIKHHCPEFFPPDLMVQKAMHPTHLQSNIFKGIKIPKETKTQTEFARFPVNDLRNFASVAAPARTEQAFMESVYNYRQRLGSSNTPSDIKTGFAEQMKSTHRPYGMKRPSDETSTVIGSSTLSDASTDVADLASLMHAPATLTLGKNTRRTGMTQFDQEFKFARSFMAPESRALISNIASSDKMENVLTMLFPSGFGPRGPINQGKMTHGEVLSTLNHKYQGDRKALSIISRADAAAKAQGVIPDQSVGLMSYILGYREETDNVQEARIEEMDEE